MKDEMMDAVQKTSPTFVQLERIEALLAQGNALRSEAIALQKQSFEVQRSQIEKADLLTDRALDMQRRARPVIKILFVALAIMVSLAIYTSFFQR